MKIIPYTLDDVKKLKKQAHNDAVVGSILLLLAFVIPIAIISLIREHTNINQLTQFIIAIILGPIFAVFSLLKLTKSGKIDKVIKQANKEQCRELLEMAKKNADIDNFRLQLIANKRLLSVAEYNQALDYYNQSGGEDIDSLYNTNKVFEPNYNIATPINLLTISPTNFKKNSKEEI